jgi:hypothetical protein
MSSIEELEVPITTTLLLEVQGVVPKLLNHDYSGAERSRSTGVIWLVSWNLSTKSVTRPASRAGSDLGKSSSGTVREG